MRSMSRGEGPVEVLLWAAFFAVTIPLAGMFYVYYLRSQPLLSAAPSIGAAPLAVQFTAMHGTPPGTFQDNVSLNFGDGHSAQISCFSFLANDYLCNWPVALSHTYAAAGTYTATLTQISPCASGNTECAYVLGHVTITAQ